MLFLAFHLFRAQLHLGSLSKTKYLTHINSEHLIGSSGMIGNLELGSAELNREIEILFYLLDQQGAGNGFHNQQNQIF